MRPIEIHLSEPFKEVLASLLTLPSTHAETDELHLPDTANSVRWRIAKGDAEVKEALRSLYEAAHGRQVETQIGFVAIAPTVAGFLKERPYYVATQDEFFLEAFTRILTGDSLRKSGTNGSQKPESERVTNRHGMGAPQLPRREQNTFFSQTSPRIFEQPTNNAFMTNLPIHISAHHLSLSDALHQFALKKITSVCRFANDALAADVVLRRHAGAKERFSASARLALPGRDIHGRAVASNLYTAIGKLVAKLARLSRKRKTRFAKTFEHPGRSKTSSELTVPLAAQTVLFEPNERVGGASCPRAQARNPRLSLSTQKSKISTTSLIVPSR